MKEENIRKYVKLYEDECGYADKLLYFPCLRDVKKIKLDKIKETDIDRGPVQAFLINWGGMRRTLIGNGQNRGWEKKVLLPIIRNCNKLENFKKLKLENVILKGEIEKGIMDCYKALRKYLGPTTISKFLHLLAPQFFPMWDSNMRENKKKKGRGIKTGTALGYYNFISEIQKNYLERYNKLLSKLSKKYKKPKVKIVDEYFYYRYSIKK